MPTFVELFEGTPILGDGVTVTTEGVFPGPAGATNLVGALEAGAEISGILKTGVIELVAAVEAASELAGSLRLGFQLVGNVEAASEVNGSTLTVTAAEFVGWGIPMGV